MQPMSATRTLLAAIAIILLLPYPTSAHQCMEDDSIWLCPQNPIEFTCLGGDTIRACYDDFTECWEFTCPNGGTPPPPYCEHHCN